MASGFIYLIILGMWMAYFLPRWVTNHDQASGKSAERYKSAMRVVGEVPANPEEVIDKSAPAKKQNTLLIRRIVFGSLAILLLVVGVGALIGFFSPIIELLPLSASFIYVIHVRRQVVASQIKTRRVKAFEKITAAEIITEPIEKITFSSRIDFAVENKEHWIPLAERSDTAGVVVIPREGNGWQPTKVPQPTYVTAPKAVPAKRIIDLTVPGAWSAEQKAQAESVIPTRDELFDQVLAEEAAVQRYGVVNE
jgi:hypothetical protein